MVGRGPRFRGRDLMKFAVRLFILHSMRTGTGARMAALLLIGLIACSTEPRVKSLSRSSYALRTVAGDTLPYVRSDSHTVTFGSIWADTGKFIIVASIEWCPTCQHGRYANFANGGSDIVHGDSVAFYAKDPMTGDSLSATAAMRADSLIFPGPCVVYVCFDVGAPRRLLFVFSPLPSAQRP